MKFVGKIHAILFVKDQSISSAFYQSLFQKKPDLEVEGMTEFWLANNFILGLMPQKNAYKIVGLNGTEDPIKQELPQSEMYFYVESLETVFERFQSEEIQIVSSIQPRNWGDTAFYIQDPDGHLLAFAQKNQRSSIV